MSRILEPGTKVWHDIGGGWSAEIKVPSYGEQLKFEGFIRASQGEDPDASEGFSREIVQSMCTRVKLGSEEREATLDLLVANRLLQKVINLCGQQFLPEDEVEAEGNS